MAITLQAIAASQDSATTSSRNIRRAYLSPDTLRTYKLTAGEWVRLTSTKGGEVVVQLWPQAGVADNRLFYTLTGTDSLGLILDPIQILSVSEGSIEVSRFEAGRCRGIAKTVSLIGAVSAGREATWLDASVKETLSE